MRSLCGAHGLRLALLCIWMKLLSLSIDVLRQPSLLVLSQSPPNSSVVDISLSHSLSVSLSISLHLSLSLSFFLSFSLFIALRLTLSLVLSLIIHTSRLFIPSTLHPLSHISLLLPARPSFPCPHLSTSCILPLPLSTVSLSAPACHSTLICLYLSYCPMSLTSLGFPISDSAFRLSLNLCITVFIKLFSCWFFTDRLPPRLRSPANSL